MNLEIFDKVTAVAGHKVKRMGFEVCPGDTEFTVFAGKDVLAFTPVFPEAMIEAAQVLLINHEPYSAIRHTAVHHLQQALDLLGALNDNDRARG